MQVDSIHDRNYAFQSNCFQVTTLISHYSVLANHSIYVPWDAQLVLSQGCNPWGYFFGQNLLSDSFAFLSLPAIGWENINVVFPDDVLSTVHCYVQVSDNISGLLGIYYNVAVIGFEPIHSRPVIEAIISMQYCHIKKEPSTTRFKMLMTYN